MELLEDAGDPGYDLKVRVINIACLCAMCVSVCVEGGGGCKLRQIMCFDKNDGINQNLKNPCVILSTYSTIFSSKKHFSMLHLCERQILRANQRRTQNDYTYPQ